MAQKDREKWDKKFASMPELLAPREPAKAVKEHYHDSPGKLALDVACGGGRHTLFLSERGFSVDAVDISSVALEKLAKKVNANVSLHEADLDTYIPQKDYDIVVMTNFLDRDLIARIKATLKPQALFIIETYMDDARNEKKESNPDFLLAKKELLSLFNEGYEILAYDEFENESYEKYRMMKQAIVAKKC